jgi:hypothetical protein
MEAREAAKQGAEMQHIVEHRICLINRGIFVSRVIIIGRRSESFQPSSCYIPATALRCLMHNVINTHASIKPERTFWPAQNRYQFVESNYCIEPNASPFNIRRAIFRKTRIPWEKTPFAMPSIQLAKISLSKIHMSLTVSQPDIWTINTRPPRFHSCPASHCA